MLAKDLPKSGISLFTYNCHKKKNKLSFLGVFIIHPLLVWK